MLKIIIWEACHKRCVQAHGNLPLPEIYCRASYAHNRVYGRMECRLLMLLAKLPNCQRDMLNDIVAFVVMYLGFFFNKGEVLRRVINQSDLPESASWLISQFGGICNFGSACPTSLSGQFPFLVLRNYFLVPPEISCVFE